MANKKPWIKQAIKKPGALHEQMGVPAGKKIPAGKLAKAAQSGGKLGQRARLAQTLKGMKSKKGGAGDMPPGMPSAGGGALAAMAANIARGKALRGAAGPRGK